VTLSWRTRKLTGWFLAGVLLIAQAIGAANACVVATHSPAMAFAETIHPSGCTQTVNKNACLQQCTFDDQSTTQVQFAVAEMPRLAVLVVPDAIDSSAKFRDAFICLAHSPDPPASIRFCSFQI
jgi:hypothetical protein